MLMTLLPWRAVDRINHLTYTRVLANSIDVFGTATTLHVENSTIIMFHAGAVKAFRDMTLSEAKSEVDALLRSEGYYLL